MFAKLSEYHQATVFAAAAKPLAELNQTLSGIQASVTVISGRLDIMHDSQLQQQKVQTDLAKRLDVMEQSQTETLSQVSSRLDMMEQSQSQIFSRLDAIQNRLGRFDDLQQWRTETVDRLAAVQDAQTELSNGLTTRLDAFEGSLGTLSGRVDMVLGHQQQQQAAAAGRVTAVQQQLENIQAAVSRIPSKKTFFFLLG